MNIPFQRFPFTETFDLFNPKALYIDVIILDPRWSPFTWVTGVSPYTECGCIQGGTSSVSTCGGYYKVNPDARALRVFTITNCGGSVSLINSKIATDYSQSVVSNPNLILNPNITLQALNATFDNPNAAGNLLWANCIGYYAITIARVGRVLIRQPAYSGYFSVDKVNDPNVPPSGKDCASFFVYEPCDNNPQRRKTFQALAEIVGNLNGNINILDIPALSNLGSSIPIS